MNLTKMVRVMLLVSKQSMHIDHLPCLKHVSTWKNHRRHNRYYQNQRSGSFYILLSRGDPPRFCKDWKGESLVSLQFFEEIVCRDSEPLFCLCQQNLQVFLFILLFFYNRLAITVMNQKNHNIVMKTTFHSLISTCVLFTSFSMVQLMIQFKRNTPFSAFSPNRCGTNAAMIVTRHGRYFSWASQTSIDCVAYREILDNR